MTSNKPGRGGRRTAPYVFTEQGVAMLSSVLNSPRAIAVNIEIMRAFVNAARQLDLFYRKHAYLSTATRRFIEILKTVAKKIRNEERL